VCIGCGDLLDGPEYDEVGSTVLHVVPDLGPEEVVSAYRVAMGVIRDAFIEEAGRSGLPAPAAAAGLRMIWELTDRYSDLIASAHGPAMLCDRPNRRNACAVPQACPLRRGDRLPPSSWERLSLASRPIAPVRVFRVRVAGQPTQRTLRHMEAQALGWPGEPLLTPDRLPTWRACRTTGACQRRRKTT